MPQTFTNNKHLLNNNIQMWLFASTSVDPPPARLQSPKGKKQQLHYLKQTGIFSGPAPRRPSFTLSHNPSSIGFSVPVVYIVIILCQLSAELHN